MNIELSADDIESMDGFDMTLTKPYGIGIDTHSKFIYVVVICKINDKYKRFEKTYDTDWKSLLAAREWAETIVRNKPVPALREEEIIPFHYTIESTGTYHYPVLRAFGGKPSVVNPLLASPSRRKTDALDAKLLAYQNLTGLWPESYVVGDAINEVRVHMGQRKAHQHRATQISNQINNYILRFGLTAGRLGSVTKSSVVKPIVMNKIHEYDAELHKDDRNDMMQLFCPDDFPDDFKDLIKNMYDEYDVETKRMKELESTAIKLAKKCQWELKDGSYVEGKELIKNLITVPGIGEITAVIWLTQICTPARFPNPKACSAYCGLDPSLKVSAGHVTSTTKRGGNKELHSCLTNCASTLVQHHAEPFGIWGYQMYRSTGKWRKACAAVARRLSVAMYWVHSKNEPFSYEGYQCVQRVPVICISLDDLVLLQPDFKRYVKILTGESIYNTEMLVTAYNNLELKQIRGLGQKFYSILKDFIHNQKKYIQLCNELNIERNVI